MELTIEEVKSFLKAEKIKPSDLFGAEILADDPSVKGIIENEKRSAVAGEYAHRKRTEEGFDKTKQELEKKLGEKDAALKTMQLEVAKTKLTPLFEKQKETRKLDEKQTKYILARLPKFLPQKPEDLEKEFNAYLDAQIDDYKKDAEVFGVKTAPVENGDGKGGGTGTEPGENQGGGGEDKYLNPATNPMIKTDAD